MFVELVFFKAQPDVSDETVIQSAHIIQELAARIGHSFHIDLFRSTEGEWVEIVRWNSQAEAQQVEQAVMSMPEAQEAMRVMDATSLRMMFLNPA